MVKASEPGIGIESTELTNAPQSFGLKKVLFITIHAWNLELSSTVSSTSRITAGGLPEWLPPCSPGMAVQFWSASALSSMTAASW